MAQAHLSIDGELAQWWLAQPMYFVATAPAGTGGHVNVSPKGYDTLRILAPDRVAYLDLTGSGVETIAHVNENGRLTLMACAFVGAPRISRIYGHATVHPVGTSSFEELLRLGGFEPIAGARAVIDVAVERVTTSCGFAVPLMDLVGERDRLRDWASARGSEGLADYRASKNAMSIDSLPGFPM